MKPQIDVKPMGKTQQAPHPVKIPDTGGRGAGGE